LHMKTQISLSLPYSTWIIM